MDVRLHREVKQTNRAESYYNGRVLPFHELGEAERRSEKHEPPAEERREVKQAVIDGVGESHHPRAKDYCNQRDHRQREKLSDGNQRASGEQSQPTDWQRERKTGSAMRRFA